MSAPITVADARLALKQLRLECFDAVKGRNKAETERDQLRAELATCKDASESLIESLRAEVERLRGYSDELDGVTNALGDALARAERAEAELAEQKWLKESAVKRAKELTEELAAERENVRTLRSACESICEEWGRNHDAPFYAGSEMEKLASKALEKLEGAP